jgi:integrase
VPLTDRACAIIKAMAENKVSDFVFPGFRPDRHLTDDVMQTLLERMVEGYTVHGFRSTFKDWATECTSVANDVSEAALAHLTGDAVERAYRRTDALERRRELMEAWFLEGESASNVVTLSRASRS